MFERPQSGHRTILVHVALSSDENEAADHLEFCQLAHGAGAEILAELTVKLARPNPKYFMGSGKVDDLKALVKANKADLVICDAPISPSQERNIEQAIQCRVLDRTGLILDIFASRAQTFEGKLQVELAQLIYLSTRLVRGWTHLERQKGGIGLRGPGETQLELDRRMIQRRIDTIRRRLASVKRTRALGRRARARSNIPTVSLVGYTNAGKSSLFNRLTVSDVYAADQLFATLDPTIREYAIPRVGPIFLVDTVGFIRQLPHDLVEAFHATLEETIEAACLLIVVDAQDPRHQEQLDQVKLVLDEIQALETPSLLVYNKVDLLPGEDQVGIERWNDGRIKAVWVSAHTGEGIAALQSAIAEVLLADACEHELLLGLDQGRLRAKLYARDAVLGEQTMSDGGHALRVSMGASALKRLCEQEGVTMQSIIREVGNGKQTI